MASETLSALTLNKTTETTKQSNQLKCFRCELKYDFPKQKDDYLAHLFLEHRLVIADVEDIALLDEYLQYWQNEFQTVDFAEYCTTMLLDQLPDGTPAKNEHYFLLSDILPKDYELRQKLQKQRLEAALAQHQLERTDRNFQKECLYCRDVITGLRAEYLEHLFHKHFLQLGKPENLVYIDELIAKVQANLESLICLYCEKVFKDRVTLKEHMRKKGHKRINESNSEYDKFFLINYRAEKSKQTHKRLHQKPQRNNKNAALITQTTNTTNVAQKEQDILSDIAESSIDFESRRRHSEENDSDWSDWNGEEALSLRCLYCTQQEHSFLQLKAHMLEAHNVDFDAVAQNLNFYQKIKMINFVRRQICLLRCVTCDLRFENSETLLQHMNEAQHCSLGTQKQWDKPMYFFPTYEDDGLLCVLDDAAVDDVTDETVVRIISEETVAQINKDAERLSLENFKF